MNVGSVDSQFLLNQGYVPFGNSAAAAKENGNKAFAELLEKASETMESDTPIYSKGKAVIDRSSKLFEMCQEFETFLLKNLITSMRNTVQKSELLDTGFAGKFYEDMLYDEYAKDFAKNAGLGFAEMAYLELSGQRGKTYSQRP